MYPHIKTAQANTTRAEWVENSCRGRSEEVLVAEVDERPVGFVICMEGTAEIGTLGKLDLIAVHPEYRKRRLAYDLTAEFLDFCCQHKYALSRVGTQAHNIPSLRLYERTGFLMSRCYYSYHKHIV
jgi:ribosomal protein S18 acetylase RimI-like enzyme